MKIYNRQGARIWQKRGLKHRAKGPAVVYPNGSTEWWYEGMLHRKDGPAVSRKDYVLTEWYIKGSLHREDGPAKITSDKREWWFQGSLHRLDGPAIVYSDGKTEYWIKGSRYTFEEFKIITSAMSIKHQAKVFDLIDI